LEKTVYTHGIEWDVHLMHLNLCDKMGYAKIFNKQFFVKKKIYRAQCQHPPNSFIGAFSAMDSTSSSFALWARDAPPKRSVPSPLVVTPIDGSENGPMAKVCQSGL